MKIKSKMMFLGVKDFSSREGKIYHRLGLLDLDTQSTFLILVNDNYLEKIKDCKLYQNYDFDLVLSVGQNSLLRLGVE